MRQRKPQPPAPTYAVPAHTSVHGVEPLFKISDMSVVYGVSEGTIRRGLQAGTFQPVPWDNYPYRWRKSDVQKDLETRRNLRMRNHGRYGSHKLRTAKVTTTSGNGHRKRGRPRKKASGE